MVNYFTTVLGMQTGTARHWSGLHALIQTYEKYGQPIAFSQPLSAVCKMVLCSHLGRLCKTPDAVRAGNAESFAGAICWRVLMFSNTAILESRCFVG